MNIQVKRFAEQLGNMLDDVTEDIILEVLNELPDCIVKENRIGDQAEPDHYVITIKTKRGSNIAGHSLYVLAKTMFARLATDWGSSITGNFKESVSWTDTGTFELDTEEYIWEIPYLHYGS